MATPFGKAVRKMRIDKDVLLKDMADELGVKSAYLSAVEMGNKRITDNLLDQVVTYFGGASDIAQHLGALVEQSQPDFKVDLKDRPDEDRELLTAFARKFSDLSPEFKDNLRSELELTD